MPKVRVIGPVDDATRPALLLLLADAGLDVLDDRSVDAAAEGERDDAAEVDTADCGAAEGEPGNLDDCTLAGEAIATPVDKAQPTPAGSAPEHPAECEEDAGIMVLSPTCLADPGIERIMQAAAARGCHVIGIWPPGAPDTRLPGPFEDYGGDTVVWDVGRLRDVVSPRRPSPAWSSPDDQPRRERPLKRNKC